MQRRVEHDLYYIDNWSFLLDVKIILLTLFPKDPTRTPTNSADRELRGGSNEFYLDSKITAFSVAPRR